MERIPVQIGAAVYALCEDHFSRAIEEIIPKLSGDLADPGVVEEMEDDPPCAWCDADNRGRSFVEAFSGRARRQAVDFESLLGT